MGEEQPKPYPRCEGCGCEFHGGPTAQILCLKKHLQESRAGAARLVEQLRVASEVLQQLEGPPHHLHADKGQVCQLCNAWTAWNNGKAIVT